MIRTVRTVCPRNCYCTCGMLVTVEDGRVVRIEGDPKNPATTGRVCLKGLSYARRVTSEDRLLTPLRRTRGGGRLERVGWDDALGDIAGRLDKIKRESGPDAVLYYAGSGCHGALGQLALAFWHQYGGCTVPFGDLCWPAGLEATRLTYGANLHSHPRLTTESRFALLWGHNPAETNVHQMRLLLDAQERGCVLAVVDPRETDTSDVADLMLKPHPATDAALALGMARAIVDEGLHDRAFLDAHALGFEPFRARLADYPLERVAAITGLEATAIQELAVKYATTKPALLVAGFGLQRHRHAGQALRALALLPAITGNVGVAGGGWQYANLASHCLLAPPLPPRPPHLREGFPVSRLADGLAQLTGPMIRAAWIEKANPVSQSPNSGAVRENLGRLDLVVVVDQFLTETTGIADYVLPAESLFEHDDLVTAYWHPYLQRQARVLAPPGEVRSETAIWRALADRMGFETRWFPEDTDVLLRGMLPDSGGAFDRLADEPLDLSGRGDVAFADGVFPTPSGKVEFFSEQARQIWNVDELPQYVRGAACDVRRADEYPLTLLSCKTRDRIHSQFGNIDWIREIERPHWLDIHPADAVSRGLADGDIAAVWNGNGRIDVRVHITHGLRPGVVHLLEGRSHSYDPDVNMLTDEGVTDMGHGATFYDCRVQVGTRMRKEGWGT